MFPYKALGYIFIKMSEKSTRFRYEIAEIMIGKILILALGMISSICFSRILGSEGKGELSVISSVSGIFMQFCNFGLHSAHIYYVSKDRNVQNISEGNIMICFIFSIFLGLLCYPVFVMNPGVLKLSPCLTAIALMAFCIGLARMLLENLFLAIGDIRKYNILQIMSSSLHVLLVLAASIWLKVDALLVASISIVGQVVTLAFSFCSKNMVRPKISFRFFRQIMPYGMKSYTSCLVTYLLLRTDILMMNYFLPKKEVGLYAVAVSLSDMLYMVSSSVTTVLFPKLSSFDTMEQKREMLEKVLKVMLPVIFMTAVVIGVLAKIAVPILYGEEYLGSVLLVRVLLVSSIAWGVSGFAFSFFSADNKFFETIIIPLIGFGINVIMNFFLIQKIGALGAAIASDVSYTFVAVAIFFCMCRYIRREKAGRLAHEQPGGREK